MRTDSYRDPEDTNRRLEEAFNHLERRYEKLAEAFALFWRGEAIPDFKIKEIVESQLDLEGIDFGCIEVVPSDHCDWTSVSVQISVVGRIPAAFRGTIEQRVKQSLRDAGDTRRVFFVFSQV